MSGIGLRLPFESVELEIIMKVIHNMFWIISLGLLPQLSHAQHQHVMGTVRGVEFHESHQDTIPLFGAEIFWLNTQIGTTTDKNGRYHLERPERSPYVLVFRYVEYENDTVAVTPNVEAIDVVLHSLRTIGHVTVEADEAHFHEHLDAAINTRTISEAGLRTLACCTLSESFENTAAVDVEYSDAVSGAKRIKMLGLAGYYTQILVEKNPFMSGLISPFALEFIPGAWMDAIDISKGTASVVTGYESTTGQINVELKKPENRIPVFLNLYQNTMGKTEGSLIASRQITPRLHTMLLTYGTWNRRHLDINKDTFLDMPLVNNFNLMNRWSIQKEHAHIQFGFSALRDHRDGGQTQFDFSDHKATDQMYGFHSLTNRIQTFLKAGFALDHEQTHSVGLILTAFRHDQDGFWGIKNYKGEEQQLYANLLYQKSGELFKLSTGLSLLWDDKTESVNQQSYIRDEQVPGTFTEVTLQNIENLTAMIGFRYDRHNLYGDFYTPRFHAKVNLGPLSTFRISAGKGFRSPNIFLENLMILASSKDLEFQEEIKAEEAWNYGAQWTYHFAIDPDRPVSVVLDYYRTDFRNQVVVDSEQEFDKIYIYNLAGKSYSNSFQAEVTATLFKGFETTLAGRLNDVKTTLNGDLLDHPLTSRYKGLIVISYLTPTSKWKFDFTTQLNGKSRLPRTDYNPEEYQKAEYSPVYHLLFGQITRRFKNWELYAGMENITDYRQEDPILSWQEPFSPYFDSSLVWGPTVGRRIYIGIRLN